MDMLVLLIYEVTPPMKPFLFSFETGTIWSEEEMRLGLCYQPDVTVQKHQEEHAVKRDW